MKSRCIKVFFNLWRGRLLHTLDEPEDIKKYKIKKNENKNQKNKQIPWGIYVPRLIFIWGVKNR